MGGFRPFPQETGDPAVHRHIDFNNAFAFFFP
jgi:hypothetical protein